MSDLDLDPMDPEEIKAITPEEVEELSDRDRIEQRDQELGGDLLDGIDAEELEEIPASELLETSGMCSHVRDQDGEELGHILMIDFDDVDDVMIPLSSADRQPGISIVSRSSPGSYHHHNLSVRSFDEQIREGAAETGDLGHIRWAARRGYFVLRILGKRRIESGELYKEPPEIVSVISSESDLPQSRRHLQLLRSIIEDQGSTELLERLDAAREEHELIGRELSVDHYKTITDSAKEALR
jgi:hypothetical protein